MLVYPTGVIACCEECAYPTLPIKDSYLEVDAETIKYSAGRAIFNLDDIQNKYIKMHLIFRDENQRYFKVYY